MKRMETIYSSQDYSWSVIARDPDKPGYIIDTNEYLIVSSGQGLLTDPGGSEIFPEVFSAICEKFDPTQITKIFSSHQDPDIISSLSLWLEVNPEIKCYLSWLWSSFVPHFGGKEDTFIQIPDPGMDVVIGDHTLRAIPAHYLHSSGNFNLYDPSARILFSGDIGASLLPPEFTDLFVTDFDKHTRYMKKFHQRWMGSNEAKKKWIKEIRNLKVDMMVPQHGALFQKEEVQNFLDWFDELEVGITEN
ncbi:MBL fold metallo-hydrolase [Leptospira sp. 201903071]|uniref:MBL fold metallo-hydrolase n=1 Tax=Leptospira ainazelensis TaxID=2810034 RepID=UPI00196262F2|nr:MBL fold metallo-hydrolase [Leptospira ainazelensis]MBM9502072.1 MBL fold metallo-hydrolase [Leptospira ainazelensis]